MTVYAIQKYCVGVSGVLVCPFSSSVCCRGQLKCDGTRAETRFRLSAKRTSRFKSAGASVQSTAGSRGVRISGSNAGYTMFRDSVKGTGYPLHSPVSPSFPVLCVTVCHHISVGVYHCCTVRNFQCVARCTHAHAPNCGRAFGSLCACRMLSIFSPESFSTVTEKMLSS